MPDGTYGSWILRRRIAKRRKTANAVLAALKIEMGHPHITASAFAVMYPTLSQAKLKRVALR
jgi:hypothetical protein